MLEIQSILLRICLEAEDCSIVIAMISPTLYEIDNFIIKGLRV